MNEWFRWFQNSIGDLRTIVSDLALPPTCIYCQAGIPEGRGEISFCPKCLEAVAPLVWRGCRRCGTRFSGDRSEAADCPFCRRVKLHFDRVVPLGAYRDLLRTTVLQMKRPANDALSLSIGRLLAHLRIAALREIRPEIVMPIPMHWTRRWGRGINSPEVLAECLGNSLQVPIQESVLRRCRNTPPQARLAPARRFDNVRGAFDVRRPKAIDGARILLVDDVLTTGATCSEAAKVLKRAGAAMVAVAVVARAERKNR